MNIADLNLITNKLNELGAKELTLGEYSNNYDSYEKAVFIFNDVEYLILEIISLHDNNLEKIILRYHFAAQEIKVLLVDERKISPIT